MALREQNAAPQIRAGSIALSIVLPWVPGRQVFPVVNVGRHDAPKFPRGNLPPRKFQRGVKTELESHQHPGASSLDNGLEAFGTFERIAHRFLQQYAAARLRRFERRVDVQRGRIGNDRAIWPMLAQRVSQIALDLKTFEVGVRQGPLEFLPSLEVLFAEGNQVSQMAAADRAKADDKNLCHVGWRGGLYLGVSEHPLRDVSQTSAVMDRIRPYSRMVANRLHARPRIPTS